MQVGIFTRMELSNSSGNSMVSMSLKCLVRRFMMFISGMVYGSANAGTSNETGRSILEVSLVNISLQVYLSSLSYSN